MRPLRYSINITLDGCCHHEAGLAPDEESMRSGMSHEGGRGDSEADRSSAGVKALVPHRDREICRAECKRTGEMNCVGPAELMR